VTVADGAIENVRVLEFRESRGWEVRYPFFTDQFVDARLEDDGRLDRRIDGITGATLSVAAVTRIARIALLLDGTIKTTG
jgi:Na+-translocating ferredoxin:NAD+ oxidoreductase RnfG subunit